jgi:hypothetical protein
MIAGSGLGTKFKEKKLKIKLLFFYLLILLNCKAYKTFNYINNLSNFIV